MKSFASKANLLATTIFCGAAIGFAAPAYAQDDATADQSGAQAADTGGDEEIVVTGTLFRTQITPSPVTTLTADDLDRRGINTVQEAIQTISSNNGAALTNSFTANGAFAAGASAVSLRGLSTSSTLVLFDGMRGAYYPLSDDGTRNFVDLNTIPDDIVERIEVLRDGASSTYGADAIAGVVNIITRREFQGLSARAEAGISQRGDAGNQRISVTAGTGDLDTNGINAYVSGFYYHSDKLFNRERPYPYNSADQRGICLDNVCGPNGNFNGLDEDGVYPGGFGTGTTVNVSTLYVRPYDATNTNALGRYQAINPLLGCGPGTSHTLTPAELANDAAAPTSVCIEDPVNEYGVIQPEIERFGGSARVTARVGDDSEAFLQVNFLQTTSSYPGAFGIIRGAANAGVLYPPFRNNGGAGILTLPVYVCPRFTVGVCDANNGTLNPNNPFAAQGQVARLVGRIREISQYNETRTRAFRAAAGIGGTIFGDWDYRVDLSAMHIDLRRTQNGYIYIQHLLDVVADGSFDFINPANNDQADYDYLSPDNITNSSSDLYQAQFTLGHALAQLPGGPLQLGVGAAIRYEAVDAPSANDDLNGPTERYFVLNAFGTSGSRTVYSAFAELNAPILDQLEVNLSGRYDSYSSGQSNFSPKAGIIFRPIPQVTLRGTYSRGFRIPSFAEANALPTTGFATQAVAGLPASFLAQYGPNCRPDNAAGCPTYITSYAIGFTTLASPDLDPEKSRSFTLGVLLEPIPNVTIGVDYYNIRKTGAITGPGTAEAIAAYYAGQPIPDGFTVIPNIPDPNFPNALPIIQFVQSQLINAQTIQSTGLDFNVTGRFRLGPDLRFTTQLEASYIIELSTTQDGVKQRYEGTLGNFNLTAGSGTPQWHGSWVNSLEFGRTTFTATANYFDGYNLSAADQGDTPGDCGQGGPFFPCDVDSYITVDLSASYELNEHFTFYLNVLNALDDLPPIDPVTYGANNYNAVQGGTGLIGRAFRAGVRVNF
jgi:iron complex outermembrane receptor protein